MATTKTNPRTQAMIKQNEGFSGKSYADTVSEKSPGTATIGYGVNVGDPAIRNLTGWDASTVVTPQQAQAKLDQVLIPNAVKDAKIWLGESTFNKLSIPQQQAITDMSYQLGLPTLAQFKKLKAALLAGDYTTAAREMLNSKAAQQTPERYKANAQLLLQGNP